MREIAIYGAGGLGREIACLIKKINEAKRVWKFIGFFDDGKVAGTRNEYGTILGGQKELNAWKKPLAVCIAIGTPETVRQVAIGIRNSQVDFPNIIAPDCVFLDKKTAFLGQGNIICFRSLISCNVALGDFNLLNGSVILGHDVRLGSFNAIMPGTRISGNVHAGDENFFGVSSCILQGLNVGDKTKLGACSVLAQDAADGAVYSGVPAKKMLTPVN